MYITSQVTLSYLILHGGGGHDDPAEDEAGGGQRDQREGRGLVVINALVVGSVPVHAIHVPIQSTTDQAAQPPIFCCLYVTYDAEEDGDGEKDERGHHEHEGEAARDEEAEGAKQVRVHLGGLVHLRLDRLEEYGGGGVNECTVEGGRGERRVASFLAP